MKIYLSYTVWTVKHQQLKRTQENAVKAIHVKKRDRKKEIIINKYKKSSEKKKNVHIETYRLESLGSVVTATT